MVALLASGEQEPVRLVAEVSLIVLESAEVSHVGPGAV